MKKEIKFIASIADGKVNPNLGFIRLKESVIQGGNQHVFVQMDCETGLDLTINAARALSAVNAIKGDVTIKQTKKGVTLSGGGVRIVAPTIDNDTYPDAIPSGDKIDISGEIINQLAIAKQFAGDNDVRQYLNGVAINDGRVKASNGHFAVSLDGITDIDVILPVRAVDLLVKIGDEPESVSQGNGSITFYYQWGWVRCATIDGKFPSIDGMFAADGEFSAIGELAGAVSTCKSVIGNSGKIHIEPNIVTGDDSTEIDVETGLNRSTYNCGLLSTMLAYADSISIPDDESPKAVFKGKYDMMGVISPVIR